VLNRKKRSHKTESIQKGIMLMTGSKGQGVIWCKVRVSGSEGRARIPREDGADAVQYAWATINKGDEIPADINSAFFKKDISTKAIFHFNAGHENITKWMVIHARWYNTRHPHLAGTWCAQQMFVIG